MIIDPKVLQSIPNSENQTCFACGPNNPNGLKMKFSTDGKRVYSFICAPSTMTGWDQTVHGGILTTMLDEVMGWGVIYLLKKIGMTKSITVDFVKAVYAGERLTIVGGIQAEHNPMALTKQDIVERICEQLGFPRNRSIEITETLLELIKSTLASGDDVLISGFGKFCVKEKAERKGRNPATGEDAILPARRVVTFKCSGQLRDKVNGC